MPREILNFRVTNCTFVPPVFFGLTTRKVGKFLFFSLNQFLPLVGHLLDEHFITVELDTLRKKPHLYIYTFHKGESYFVRSLIYRSVKKK